MDRGWERDLLTPVKIRPSVERAAAATLCCFEIGRLSITAVAAVMSWQATSVWSIVGGNVDGWRLWSEGATWR